MIDDKLNKALQAVFSIGCQVGALDKDYKTSGVKYIPTGEIADIKQAFADEGYTQLTAMPTATEIAMFESIRAKYPKYMTGQEWYSDFDERMSAQFEMWRDGGNGFVEIKYVREAAKKAAGL